MSQEGPRLRGGIDVSPLELTRAGTARYIVNLLAELAKLDEVDLRRFSFGGSSRLAKVARDMLWYPVVLPFAAGRADVDFLHCTTIRAPLASRVPVVVTVHDVSPLRRPETFNRWTRWYTKATLARVVRAAAAVITVSEFQRREVEELAGLDRDRIRVVPQGVGDPFTADGPAAEGEFVLAVATLEPRKNLPQLVEGFQRAGLDGCELRIVGASGWGGVDVRGRGVVKLGRVPDEELAALYRGARCLVYPSLYEGFGLPVLEAMACGTPVVCPAGPPFDEFAAGVTISCDPLDPGSIASAIQEAAGGRQELGPRGRERAAAFTWARTAHSTLQVYREVAA